MGLIGGLMDFLFGNGRNVVVQTAEVFRENSEKGAERAAPEPLWWLMGAIVSFYFGARHQSKGQEFQRSVARSLVMSQHLKPPEVPGGKPAAPVASNAALLDWQDDNG